jgi:hypothetical protein
MIDQENVEKYAQDHDVPFSNYASLTRAPEVQALIQGRDRRVNKKFARVEQIKKFFLLDTQLSAEDEELTPTMKLKRKLVEKKYAEQIEAMYRDPTTNDFTTKETDHEPQALSEDWPALATLAAAGHRRPPRPSRQGVSKNEIVLGSIQDLSGPIAGFGKQVRRACMLRVDEINEQGGINGRKIKLLIEDSAYDPKKAVLAAQKLVNQDKIFAMVGHIGTAQNNGGDAGAVREERDQLLPGHRGARDVRALPQAQVRLCRHLLRPDAHRRAQAGQGKGRQEGLHDVPGRRVRPGGDARRRSRPEDHRHDLAEKTTYKRGATDFSSQVARR